MQGRQSADIESQIKKGTENTMNASTTQALRRAEQELRPAFPTLTVDQLKAGVLWALAQNPERPADTPPAAEPGRLLKCDEVCTRLGIKKRKFWIMIEQGVLPRVKLGARSTRVPEEAVNKLSLAVPRLNWHRQDRAVNAAPEQQTGKEI